MSTLTRPARLVLVAVALSVLTGLSLALWSADRKAEAVGLLEGRSDEQPTLASYRRVLNMFEQATRYSPDTSPLSRKAMLFAIFGSFANAEEAANEIVSREPENEIPWLILARVYRNTNRPEDARKAVERARALNPLGD